MTKICMIDNCAEKERLRDMFSVHAKTNLTFNTAAVQLAGHFYTLHINLNAKSKAYKISDLYLSIKLEKVEIKHG